MSPEAVQSLFDHMRLFELEIQFLDNTRASFYAQSLFRKRGVVIARSQCIARSFVSSATASAASDMLSASSAMDGDLWAGFASVNTNDFASLER